MLKPGDKLYNIFCGTLEVVEFCAEIKLSNYKYYQIKYENGSYNNVDPRGWFTTRKEAYQQYLKESEELVGRLVEERKQLEASIAYKRNEVLKIAELLKYIND